MSDGVWRDEAAPHPRSHGNDVTAVGKCVSLCSFKCVIKQFEMYLNLLRYIILSTHRLIYSKNFILLIMFNQWEGGSNFSLKTSNLSNSSKSQKSER